LLQEVEDLKAFASDVEGMGIEPMNVQTCRTKEPLLLKAESMIASEEVEIEAYQEENLTLKRALLQS
jgi:hypothetical protein